MTTDGRDPSGSAARPSGASHDRSGAAARDTSGAADPKLSDSPDHDASGVTAADPSGLRRYARDGGAVTFETAICEHAGECVRGLPDVFDTAKRPWIQPAHASLDEIETVVGRCPSLALKFERSPIG